MTPEEWVAHHERMRIKALAELEAAKADYWRQRRRLEAATARLVCGYLALAVLALILANVDDRSDWRWFNIGLAGSNCALALRRALALPVKEPWL